MTLQNFSDGEAETELPPARHPMRSGRFERLVLPGFAFKAVVIGGGYATGRELAAFFLPAGPRGGLYGMLLATAIWSIVSALTFLFAFRTRSRDYRTFFHHLLGPFWPVFEIAYLLALMVILAVFAAAAGAVGRAMFGWPELVGAIALVIGIGAAAMTANDGVERLFKYVTILLYGTYALFVILLLGRYGDRMTAALAAPTPITGWALGGLTYAGYNIIGAVIVLPVTRHLTSSRDAVIAGLLAGPFAMLPALLFFLCMIAFYPAVGAETLPSDFLLRQLGSPAFRLLFQLMVFSALLESGTGGVHAINERVAKTFAERRGRPLPRLARLGTTATILVGSVFIAGQFGLVTLVAQGFSWLSAVLFVIYILPLVTIGVWRLRRARSAPVTMPA